MTDALSAISGYMPSDNTIDYCYRLVNSMLVLVATLSQTPPPQGSPVPKSPLC